MKFKMGDTVEVVRSINYLDDNFKIGHRGTIVSYERDEPFSYRVKRRNGNTQFFNVKELKLIKRKGD